MISKNKIYNSVWISCLTAAAVTVFLLVEKHNPETLPSLITSDWILFTLLLLLSTFCKYLKASIGMGYGTTMLPILLLMGLLRQEIVPAILFSEFLTGFFCGIAHHKEGNVNLKTNKNIHRAVLILGTPSLIGVIIAIFLGLKLSVHDQLWLNLYTGLMISSLGIFLIYSYFFLSKQKSDNVGVGKLIILGFLASFNKGVSGGGYGPLMTGGQIASGIREKEAIVVTSLCECFTCFIGLVAFFVMGGNLNLSYVVPLCIGSMLAVIPAAKTIKIIPEGLLKSVIGWATLFLGLIIIYQWIIT